SCVRLGSRPLTAPSKGRFGKPLPFIPSKEIPPGPVRVGGESAVVVRRQLGSAVRDESFLLVVPLCVADERLEYLSRTNAELEHLTGFGHGRDGDLFDETHFLVVHPLLLSVG